MTKIVLKFVLLVILVFFVSSFFDNIFSEKKRGHEVWRDFYDLPKNSLDLVFVGSSLSYSSFNPLIFNGFLNISSCNTGTALQNIKQNYYNLKEILEHHSPKLIVLEAYSLDIPDKSENDRLGFKFENIDAQRFSLNKLASIHSQFTSLKNKLNALSPLIRNHDNWNDLELLQDNLSNTSTKNRFLGYKLVKEEVKPNYLKKNLVNLPSEHFFNDENLDYFKKFKDLCEKNNIRLIVVRAPVLLYKYNTEYYQEVYTNTKSLCENENIEYLDYNQKFHQLSLDESYYADEKHLNYKGAIKISEHLASHLKNHDLINGNKLGEKQFYEPEDFVYSNRFNSKLQTIFSGNHTITDNIIIKEVYIVKVRDNEYSLIVKLDDRLDFDEMADYSFGYYFYPVDSQVQLLETEKDLKRKYASLGDYGAPMYFKNNYYVTLRSYKMQPNQFKKIKIQPYNKSGNLGKSLIIENVVFK